MKTDLDDAFAQAAHIPNGDGYRQMWQDMAKTYRDSGVRMETLPYGSGARQVCDLFLPDGPPQGVVVFVHGGYWKASGKSDWSHLAAGPLAAGWAVAIPSYDLCPDVSIAEITQQVTNAIGTVAARVPGPLRLTGHSAGGHLVCRMLAPGVGQDWAGRIARVVPIAPVTDLEPLLQTQMNEVLQLDRDSARAASPIHQPPPDAPVTLWVGAQERPVLLAQAHALADRWGCDCVTVPDTHHFDVIAPLAAPDSDLTRTLLG